VKQTDSLGKLNVVASIILKWMIENGGLVYCYFSISDYIVWNDSTIARPNRLRKNTKMLDPRECGFISP
jgi:hypothetical protein